MFGYVSQVQRNLGKAALLASVLAAGVYQAPAHALPTSLTFDFNSLSDGANNTSVQTYMRNALAAAGAGTVNVSGTVASNDYTGDNHVVGPVSGHTVTSLTLGTSDGATPHLPTRDTFITNISGTTTFTMTFSQTIYSVGFDYEIFPDGTCPNGNNNCGSNWPDFKFNVGATQIFDTLGVMPSSSQHSPDSGWNKTENAPQYLGVSGTMNFANGVTQLSFIDWPATIGIDNLVVGFAPPTPAPEPATLGLFAFGVAGLGFIRRRR
jgi:hypothetical protein